MVYFFAPFVAEASLVIIWSGYVPKNKGPTGFRDFKSIEAVPKHPPQRLPQYVLAMY